jgi:hypothetical protein
MVGEVVAVQLYALTIRDRVFSIHNDCHGLWSVAMVKFDVIA